MSVKALIYCVIVPLMIWILDGIDINKIFKKNRNIQATLFYLVICICLSYLVVNFFYDFFLNSAFIK